MNTQQILFNLRALGVRNDWIGALEGVVESQAKLLQAVEWVVRDASYKAPEEVNPELVQLYLSKLIEATKP